ncbi:vacuolar protein sorting-associated protein VTA1 [Biomphalaria pfeifferi]|uniref:Vacuolar protein sorting-associated protein VTA1 n=1 Tax=Biomphalaria pfeifferi TaxID=112525 RepID=A0AAD8BND5_BIOPF|nr:vacuolar protein sorting-associated protein VTA1 [Biomphalaria pfeifferi]
MSAPGIATIPTSLKGAIQKYIRVAVEHDKRDPVIAYYCRLYAMQQAMAIDKSSLEARQYLVSLMDFLEKSKNQLKDEQAVHNEIIGQAHVENYALKLFLYADNEDRAGHFGKNVIKAFLTSSLLMDVLTTFGDLSEDIEKNRRYAKWKALYINKCIQSGETPIAGPLPEDGDGYDIPGIGFENVAGPSEPPNHMTFSTDSGLYPAPGAHAPPSTPQDPPASTQQPIPQRSPQPTPRAAVSQTVTPDWEPPPNPAGLKLTPEQFQKGIKYCKFASSAMQYEDAKTAIDNLTKALRLLTTGKE